MNKPLIVYKASAGSGKTFTLASEYIKLLVRNPQAYRQILAVTFTNKATEEMKMRILSQLYGIWRGLPSSKNYADKVSAELDVSPAFVQKQAGLALTNLLHNYSYFRVETIDSFFQSVLRNLARELDLTANLRIGLNDGEVEEMAVDQLIESLSVTDQMLQWLMKYIMENISDDRSWNVIGQIKKFGKTIFRDYYKQWSRQLYDVIGQKDFLEDYAANMRSMRESALKRMKEIGDAFFEELTGAGFTVEDLSYGKSGVGGLFLKLQNGIFDESVLSKRATDCVGVPEKWYKKTHERREELHALADGVLDRLLRQAIDEQPVQWKRFKSADLVLHHLHQLRLLDSIEKKVRELNDGANRFLLSDTQQLLHDLMDGSDSPFVFEKIGTQLEHIMIDEFQDTSTVQWQNFKVLLEETMSHEHTENLIVGDVKQSIYRWRSGDWRLLSGITSQFPQPSQQLDIRTLDTNYRSYHNVVRFNNAFFLAAAMIEEATAYDDVKQELSPKQPEAGYVNVTLLPAEDYEQQTLDLLVSEVRQLIDCRVSPDKIAILVRTNSLIPLIANYFMEHLPEVRIVSDEAFRLDASPAVQTIIQAMRVLTRPEDLIAKAYLVKMHTGRLLHEVVLDEQLPEAFAAHTDELLRLPIYELAERLFRIFSLQRMEGQAAYLCAFYDQLATFANEQSTDIPMFLDEWAESIGAKTIQSPEIEGIRLISIHKSKGLEFPHVLIPFCDWKMEHNDILWCHPSEKPFSDLPIVPIDFSKKGMMGTVFEKDYEEEHQQNVIDNLNLLYVAFTRAGAGLYIIGKRGSKSSRSTLIEMTLPETVRTLNETKDDRALGDGRVVASLMGEEDEASPLIFEYGERLDASLSSDSSSTSSTSLTSSTSPTSSTGPSGPSPEKEENVFLSESKPLHPTIEVFEQRVHFRQSNRSRDFATPDDDEEQQQQNRYIQMGSILHEVFSTIRTTADIDSALRRMELEGVIYDEELTRSHIASMIRKRLENPRVADWFSPRWTLFNECTILSVEPVAPNVAEGEPASSVKSAAKTRVVERRPDRVMTDGEHTVVVDFKFGRPNNDYHDQVRKYMQLLSRMGHRQVEGYLWYVYSNKIEPVKPEN